MQNDTLLPGENTLYTRDLERVGEEDGVVVRVQYRFRLAGGQWSNQEVESNAFHCDDGEHVHVILE